MSTDKPFVWLHSDSYIPDCDCGAREWQVDLPDGWIYTTPRGPNTFIHDQVSAMDYAASLHEGHPDVKRIPTR